jgi:all-trans-8'-apo-beta-carotenal 15,15'-oxygenase
MLRRSLLSYLLQGTAVAAGAVLSPRLLAAASADPGDVLRETYARFHAARKSHPELAGFVSQDPKGLAPQMAELSGRWPTALRGRLLRNGPGLFERDGMRYQHWFDGDGLLQQWHISGDAKARVLHQARFIQTPKFLREEKAQRFQVMAAGTTIPNAKAVGGPDDANTANTAIMQLGGECYALWEAGSAYRFDCETLSTLGVKTWSEELEGVAFSAHPVYEKDGRVWNIGHLGDRMVVYGLSAKGALSQSQLIELPRAGYSHSFAHSENYLIVVLAPLVKVREAQSYFEGLGFRPELGSLMVIIDKRDLSKVRYAELDSGMSYHYADAWEESDGSLHLRACWYDSAQSSVISPNGHLMRATFDQGKHLSARLMQISLKPGAKRASLSALGQSGVEFPVTLKLGGKRSDALYLQGRKQGGDYGFLSKLIRLNAQGDKTAEFDLGADFAIEEQLPVFVDGRSYAIGTALDIKRQRSGIVLFDLKAISDGPIAQAWLQRAVPLGFHGSFVKA